MWEHVQSSVIVRNFFINKTKDYQKRLCVIRSILLYSNRCSPVLSYAMLILNIFLNCYINGNLGYFSQMKAYYFGVVLFQS